MKFRKKPVIIDAIQWTGDNFEEVAAWRKSVLGLNQILDNGDKTLSIFTLEGIMTASESDWIIRGISQELYPCKPDIFGGTYEKVDE